MAPPWVKLDEILTAVHRSVDRVEGQLSTYYDKIRDTPPAQKDTKDSKGQTDQLAERNVGFAISQFRVSLPVELDIQQNEIVGRFPDHDAKDRNQDATARLTRIDFELKATPILNNPPAKK